MDIIFLTIGLAVGGVIAWLALRGRATASGGADHQKLLSTIDILKAENSRLGSQYEIERANTKNLQEQNSRLNTEAEVVKTANQLISKQNEDSVKEIAALKETNNNYFKRGTELSNELAVTRQKLETAEIQLQRAQTRITQLERDDEHRKQEHSNAISSLKQIQDKIQRDRDGEVAERNRLEIERLRKMKEKWVNHETDVKNRIKSICSRNGVDYVDKVPFKGTPDNTLRINDEFVVFDAKSPGGDDLSNFPIYIRNQAENVSKYIREEEVRKEVFLVVPTNTLDELEQFEFKLADYSVFVISIDSLEPVILLLKKIEEYEFAEQLSPEERENICRVIGKFVHLSKRRIQIDGFFAKQFFELVYRSEADLPKELLEKVVEFERAEKLNPPIERRAKQISNKELEGETERLKTEAGQRGIITHDSMLSREINKLPLYSTEKAKDKDQGSLFEG